MNTLTAAEAVQKIIDSEPLPETRFADKLAIGEVIHQGDIYLQKIEKVPPFASLSQTRQLARGNSQGSRHIVSGSCLVWNTDTLGKKLTTDYGTTIVGPVIESPDEYVTVTHPQHADHSIPPGIYQCYLQYSYATDKAVRD